MHRSPSIFTIRKTFSLSIGGIAQHLISYYKIEDVEKGRLRSPSSLPELASLDISPEYLDKTHFRNPPKVEIGMDGIPRYRGEADDTEVSPTLLPAPLSGLALYPDSGDSSKRGKTRYGPYEAGSSNSSKRRKKSSASNPNSSPIEPTSPIASVAQPTPQAAGSYPVADASPPAQPTSHYSPPYGYYVSSGYPPPVYPASSPYSALPSPAAGTPHPPTPPNASYAYPAYPAPEASYSSYYAQPHTYATYTPSPWPHYGYAQPQGSAVSDGTDARVEQVGEGGD